MKKQTGIILAILLLAVGLFAFRNQISSLFLNPTATEEPENLLSSPQADSDGFVLSLIETDAEKGDYLSDPNGMTLYTSDNDTDGMSNCYDTCVQNWPIFSLAHEPTTLPTDWSIITRTNGMKQFAFKGMPLYYYAQDATPEDLKGDGVNGVWHLAKP